MPYSAKQTLRSDDLNQILRALRERTAVLSGLDVAPTSPPSLKVIVKAGEAIINESIVKLAGDTIITISTPDPSYPRWDLVTLKSDGTVGYYAGAPEPLVCRPDVDPSAMPEACYRPIPPATPANEVALAWIWVPAGATAVNKIVDKRIIIQSAQTLRSLKIIPSAAGAPAITVRDAGNSTDRAVIDEAGNLNVVGNIAVGGTTVIDALRNVVGVNKVLQDLQISKSLPAIRLTGTETGAKDVLIRENAGLIEIYDVGAAAVRASVDVGTGIVNAAGGYAVGGAVVIDSASKLVGISSVAQSLVPDADNSRDLGSSSLRFRNAYLVTSYASALYSNGGARPYASLQPDGSIQAISLPADSVNTLRSSPPIVLRGAYWDSVAAVSRDRDLIIMLKMVGADDYHLVIRNPQTGVDLMDIDKSGNVKIPGNLTVPGAIVGDLAFKNGWRITEDDRYGLVLVSPDGKRFRLLLEEVRT